MCAHGETFDVPKPMVEIMKYTRLLHIDLERYHQKQNGCVKGYQK